MALDRIHEGASAIGVCVSVCVRKCVSACWLCFVVEKLADSGADK